MPTDLPIDPLRRVVIATDLGADSIGLFAHGLALTLHSGSELCLVHILDDDRPDATWRRLPTVRALLERWGAVAPTATVEDYAALGLRVHPLEYGRIDGDLPTALARRVKSLNPDLLIIGTHVRGWVDKVIRPPVGERAARDIRCPTLFVSDRARGLVDPETGLVRLRRVLVPTTSDLPQQSLMDGIVRLLDGLGAGPAEFVFLHVGQEETEHLRLSLPTRLVGSWKTERREGALGEQIVAAAVEHDVDLVAMVTQGHDTWVDVLRGSTTERVLHGAHCPVLAVPV